MKDLVQIIRDNPGCVAEIDNDCWTLRTDTPYPADFDNWEWEKQREWSESCVLARSGEPIIRLGSGGYGSGSCYGGDILQALAVIVGIKVESV